MLTRLPVEVDAPPSGGPGPSPAAFAAALGLIAPHLAAVLIANELAACLDPIVGSCVARLAEQARGLPSLASMFVTGRFGLLATAPLLFVWTLPTVLLHTTIQALFAESRLLPRMAHAAHPLVAPFGLSGNDVIRVTMGFGCNVPAVMAASRCGGCARGGCISAISFGAACSYQLGATLSVFAAARAAWLTPVYLLYLITTMLFFVRLTSSERGRAALAQGDPPPSQLCVPDIRRVAQTVRSTFVQFSLQALPVFALFSIVAALLDVSGAFTVVAEALSPSLRLLGLPRETAMALVMAAVRKDGILLLTSVPLSEGQLLVATYLASTLTPCLVTTWAIARVRSGRDATVLVRNQALAALGFTAALAYMVASVT